MKPAPFDYVAPTTLDGALAVLAGSEREVKVLAGGQSLIPVLNLRLGRPEVLVDVCRIPQLQRLAVDADGALHVGAAVRQAAILTAPQVASGWPMLRAAIGNIGHPQIRSRGTVCGSIAHADPAAELPAAVIALDATMIAQSHRGIRQITAEEFFQAPFTTTLEPDEVLTEVVLPAPTAGAGWGFEEFATRRGDFATAGAAALLTRAGGAVTSCRLALFGVAGTPVRVPDAEQSLLGTDAGAHALAAARQGLLSSIEPADDVHASAEFRRELAARLSATAIERAWERSRD